MQWMVSWTSLLSSPGSPDFYLCLCVGVQLPPAGARRVRRVQANALLHGQ